MATLKRDEVNGQTHRDENHVRASIGQFIEETYNRRRLHSALDYRAPEELEKMERHSGR